MRHLESVKEKEKVLLQRELVALLLLLVWNYQILVKLQRRYLRLV
jgi:hypothetical protein